MQSPCSVFSLSFGKTLALFSTVMEAENQRFSRMLTAHLSKVKKQVKKLMEAACEGDIKLFKKLAKKLDRGKGLAATVASVKDGKECGALIFAATEGKLEFCKFLVEELKIDVNEADIEGQTPVLHAARQGHTATVQYLIEKGADPAIPSTTSGTALHNAAGNGHIELVKLLLSKGVDVDLKTDEGTPLMCAASLGQEDAVKVLLEHHANPNDLTGDDIMCPLALAVAANSLPCVELLLKAGANVNVKTGEATRYGETSPLLIAAYRGNAEIINCLLQAGADPNVADELQEAVGRLLKLTPRIQSVPEWSVDGVIEFMQSEDWREQERTEDWREANFRYLLTRLEDELKSLYQREPIIPKKDLPEVNPEAKKKAAEAKARRDAAFRRNDLPRAIDCYRQAIDFDPTDGILFSNRSLCWFRLRQGEAALVDAKACVELRPDWAKAYYRKEV